MRRKFCRVECIHLERPAGSHRGGGGYSFFASPAEGQGFKLKFSVKTDGTFGVAEAPTEDALVEAARAAAPEGCNFVSLERSADGGAVADYDCG